MDWEEVRADLEGLSSDQLKLVLDLVEQMKKVNNEGQKGDSSKRLPD